MLDLGTWRPLETSGPPGLVVIGLGLEWAQKEGWWKWRQGASQGPFTVKGAEKWQLERMWGSRNGVYYLLFCFVFCVRVAAQHNDPVRGETQWGGALRARRQGRRCDEWSL